MSNLISVEKRVGKFLGGRWKASKGEEEDDPGGGEETWRFFW